MVEKKKEIPVIFGKGKFEIAWVATLFLTFFMFWIVLMNASDGSLIRNIFTTVLWSFMAICIIFIESDLKLIVLAIIHGLLTSVSSIFVYDESIEFMMLNPFISILPKVGAAIIVKKLASISAVRAKYLSPYDIFIIVVAFVYPLTEIVFSFMAITFIGGPYLEIIKPQLDPTNDIIKILAQDFSIEFLLGASFLIIFMGVSLRKINRTSISIYSKVFLKRHDFVTKRYSITLDQQMSIIKIYEGNTEALKIISQIMGKVKQRHTAIKRPKRNTKKAK